MQFFPANSGLLQKYIDSPFDILSDSEFEFERVFNFDGFYNFLYRMSKAWPIGMEYRIELRKAMAYNGYGESRDIELYFLNRFSYRYSNLKFIIGYDSLAALVSISKYCPLRLLDQTSKVVIKREFRAPVISFLQRDHSNIKNTLVDTALYKRLIYIAVLLEIKKIHFSEAKHLIRALVSKSSDKRLGLFEDYFDTYSELSLLDPKNKVLEQMHNYISDLFKG